MNLLITDRETDDKKRIETHNEDGKHVCECPPAFPRFPGPLVVIEELVCKATAEEDA